MITSTPQNRSAARLALIVSGFRVETAERYKRRDVTGDGVPETFCNFFAADVCLAMGASIPPVKANAQHEWLTACAKGTGPAPGWEQTDAHTAQAMADQGCLAIASWANPIPAGHGHIAVLMPSLGEPGVWAAQAGAINFTRELLQRGFGSFTPDYFVHP